MSIPPSRRLDFAEVPVVDLSPLVAGDRGPASAAVIEAVRQACRDVGFFYVCGHGVAKATVASLHAEAKRYFSLPLEARNEHVLDDTLRGYLPLFYRSYEGESRAGTSHQEGFWVGHERPRDASRPLDAPNRWPAALPSLKPAMLCYFEAVEALSQVLLTAFARALDIDVSRFRQLFELANSRLKLNHYPPQSDPTNENDIGVVPHSDSGAFTILWQDPHGGLEIQSKSGDWVGAPPLDDTFVINIGNVMQIWSNGYFSSTPHRVINRSGAERYSIPLFVNPGHEAPVHPLVGLDETGCEHNDEAAAQRAEHSGVDHSGAQSYGAPSHNPQSYGDYQRAIWARTFPIAGIEV